MYVPSAFRVDDLPTLHRFIRSYSFATLVTAGAEPFVTHLPLLLDVHQDAPADRGTLVGHFAKPNPHWQLDHAAHQSVAIFHGPHAYISPSWYRSGAPAVPTWNYAVVHAWGTLAPIADRDRTAAILERTVATYESQLPSPWRNEMPREMTEKLIHSVVAFEMPIDRIEAKFKLGQNRATEDQLGAIESLEAADGAGDTDSAALAAFARQHHRPGP
jgi:transcriptional regulator